MVLLLALLLALMALGGTDMMVHGAVGFLLVVTLLMALLVLLAVALDLLVALLLALMVLVGGTESDGTWCCWKCWWW